MRVALICVLVCVVGCGESVSPPDASGAQVDGAIADGPLPDATVDAATVDAAMVDAAMVDAATVDAATVDAATVDAPTPDAPTPDAPTPDAPTPDAPTPDALPLSDAAVDAPIPDAWLCMAGADGGTRDAFAVQDAMTPSAMTALTLSPNMTPDPNRDVLVAKTAPDSSRVVFIGDTEVWGVLRLYSVSVAGGAITTLSQNTTANVALDVWDFEISPDSQYVVFRGDLDADGLRALYSVPIAGGTVVKLSQNTDPTLAVDDYVISPTSDRVVFRGDLDVGGDRWLYSVPIMGGAVTLLSHSAAQEDVSYNYKFISDGSAVVFRGGAGRRLYTIPIDGGTLTELSPYNNIGSFEITPDRATVVFVLSKRLFAVPIIGGAMVTLSHAGSTPTVDLGFAISGDGTTVVFRGDTEVANVVRLYSTPVCGGSIVTLSHAAIADPLRRVNGFLIAPNSQRVVFQGDTEWAGVQRIYSVPIGGGVPTALSHGPPLDADLDAGGFMIDPSSTRVVWIGDTEIDDHYRLYMTPIGGGAITTLSHTANPSPDHTIHQRAITSSGDAVVFTGDTQDVDVRRLYWVPITGGAIETLSHNNGPDTTRWVKSLELSRDGSAVVFLGDVDVDDVDQLYVHSLQ